MRLLKEKRESLGLSMNAVAARAGVSHTMVSRVERELRKPTLDTLLRIATAMDIDLWSLIKSAEARQEQPQQGIGFKRDEQSWRFDAFLSGKLQRLCEDTTMHMM